MNQWKLLKLTRRSRLEVPAVAGTFERFSARGKTPTTYHALLTILSRYRNCCEVGLPKLQHGERSVKLNCHYTD